jgi:hypothetical protein
LADIRRAIVWIGCTAIECSAGTEVSLQSD